MLVARCPTAHDYIVIVCQSVINCCAPGHTIDSSFRRIRSLINQPRRRRPSSVRKSAHNFNCRVIRRAPSHSTPAFARREPPQWHARQNQTVGWLDGVTKQFVLHTQRRQLCHSHSTRHCSPDRAHTHAVECGYTQTRRPGNTNAHARTRSMPSSHT